MAMTSRGYSTDLAILIPCPTKQNNIRSEDQHMPQLFARPRTSNDNPLIESAYSTAKRARITRTGFWTTEQPALISKDTLTGTIPRPQARAAMY